MKESKQIIKNILEKNYSSADQLIKRQLSERAHMIVEERKAECILESTDEIPNTDFDFDIDSDEEDDDYEEEEGESEPVQFADDDENEEGWSYDWVEMEDGEINERRKVHYRVTSKGKKLRKIKCGPGYKISSDKKRCIKITGGEAMKMKIRHRKASRTKKAKGKGYLRKTLRKRGKALRRRKSLGLRNKGTSR